MVDFRICFPALAIATVVLASALTASTQMPLQAVDRAEAIKLDVNVCTDLNTGDDFISVASQHSIAPMNVATLNSNPVAQNTGPILLISMISAKNSSPDVDTVVADTAGTSQTGPANVSVTNLNTTTDAARATINIIPANSATGAATTASQASQKGGQATIAAELVAEANGESAAAHFG